MKHPKCRSITHTQVVDSRASNGHIRRRRQCTKCEQRFTTYEVLADEYDAICDSELLQPVWAVISTKAVEIERMNYADAIRYRNVLYKKKKDESLVVVPVWVAERITQVLSESVTENGGTTQDHGATKCTNLL